MMFTQFQINSEYDTIYKDVIIHQRGCRGCDRMVVGFTTTYAIKAYHN